jgi:hypothetical protein
MSFMTDAGLKKWNPMTCAGRFVAAAIAEIERADVLVARIAVLWQTLSSSANTACLISSFSGTASITKSTSLKSS